MKMAMAMKWSPPEETPAFTSSGTAANTASIIPMKWVIALPGSLIVICIWIPMLQDTCIADGNADTRTHKVFRALDEVCYQFDLSRPDVKTMIRLLKFYNIVFKTTS